MRRTFRQVDTRQKCVSCQKRKPRSEFAFLDHEGWKSLDVCKTCTTFQQKQKRA